MYQSGLMLVIISFSLWIATGVSDWWITEPPLPSGLIVPLGGFSLGGIIAGILIWLAGMLMVLMSSDARRSDKWLLFGFFLLGGAMILMFVSVISGWETIDILFTSVLFISGATLPIVMLILSFIAGFLGSLLVIISYQILDESRERLPSHENQIVRQHETTVTMQQAFREIARAQGGIKRQDQENRIETLERELAALKATNAADNGETQANEAGDDDSDLASRRSKEIAELIRRADQD